MNSNTLIFNVNRWPIGCIFPIDSDSPSMLQCKLEEFTSTPRLFVRADGSFELLVGSIEPHIP
jgi:hypothetical protein